MVRSYVSFKLFKLLSAFGEVLVVVMVAEVVTERILFVGFEIELYAGDFSSIICYLSLIRISVIIIILISLVFTATTGISTTITTITPIINFLKFIIAI